MNIKRFSMVLAIILLILLAGTVVSAQPDSIKTHEYNYASKFSFNISDDLTDEKEFKTSFFDSFEGGTFYMYSDDAFCSLLVEGEDEPGDFIAHKNNPSYEEIDANATSQGYKSYIFNDSTGYAVFIDLDNLTVRFKEGYGSQYYYFVATFETLDEAKIFIDTFRVNEISIV